MHWASTVVCRIKLPLLNLSLYHAIGIPVGINTALLLIQLPDKRLGKMAQLFEPLPSREEI